MKPDAPGGPKGVGKGGGSGGRGRLSTGAASGLLGITGRTAVVSGSTRGVGRAAAAALAAAGANVALNYVHDEKTSEEALLEIRSLGANCIAVRADVSDPEGARRLVAEAAGAFGGVDILVNCAHGRITRAMFDRTSWEDHLAHIDGILKAAYNLSSLVSEGMKSRGWGRIVNIGNNMVLQPVTGYSAYTSAMAAMLGFTRNLAAELGPFGVTVNMVSTGFVLTGNTPHTTDAVRDRIADETPLRRLATPEDVAGAVVFFAGELGRFVTGADLPVDGGKVMG